MMVTQVEVRLVTGNNNINMELNKRFEIEHEVLSAESVVFTLYLL